VSSCFPRRSRCFGSSSPAQVGSPTRSKLELVPGGEARFSSQGCVKSGWVEEALAPASVDDGGTLVFWWADDGEIATRVELTLEPAGHEATRLRVVESRPLEVLDVVGIPLPGSGEQSYGPAMLAAA